MSSYTTQTPQPFHLCSAASWSVYAPQPRGFPMSRRLQVHILAPTLLPHTLGQPRIHPHCWESSSLGLSAVRSSNPCAFIPDPPPTVQGWAPSHSGEFGGQKGMLDGTGLFPILRAVIHSWAPGLGHQGFDPLSYTAALLEEAPSLVSQWCWGAACQEFPKEISHRADSLRSNPAMGTEQLQQSPSLTFWEGEASWNRPELFLF